MDPLAQAMQLLQEAQQTIQMLAEEVQLSRQQSQGGKAADKTQDKAMTKTSSVNELGMIFGINASQVPEFMKYASYDEAREFFGLIENNMRFSHLGKVASFDDGTSYDNPSDALESMLSGILNK